MWPRLIHTQRALHRCRLRPQLLTGASFDTVANIASGPCAWGAESPTFRVDAVTHATLGYEPGANTDPDGDPAGTTITVNKPT